MTAVLVVSDADDRRAELAQRLAALAYETEVADPSEAAEQVARARPLAVLLDWASEGAPTLLGRWTGDLDLRHIPVVVVGEEGTLATALDAGAADHVPWPLPAGDDLPVRLRHALRRYAELQGLRQLASHDPLTGVVNRRAFSERLEYEFAQVHRYGGELGVAIVDLDHFKSINDTHGHDVGDLVLKQIAGRLARHLRETDTLARYGGEEFVCLLPETDQSGAQLALDRLREAVAEAGWGYTGKPIPVTFSAGVASYSVVKPRRPAELLKAADLALYRAKAAGRNKVLVWAPEESAGMPAVDLPPAQD